MNTFPAVSLKGRLHLSRKTMINMFVLRSPFIQGPSKAAFARSILCNRIRREDESKINQLLSLVVSKATAELDSISRIRK